MSQVRLSAANALRGGGGRPLASQHHPLGLLFVCSVVARFHAAASCCLSQSLCAVLLVCTYPFRGHQGGCIAMAQGLRCLSHNLRSHTP